MEDKNKTNYLAELEAPIRAEVLNELKPEQKRKTIQNLVESAMRLGLTDAMDIRLWLGIECNIDSVQNAMKIIKKKWVEDYNQLSEEGAYERVAQIKRAWENVRKCEVMYAEAKSIGDKVRVKDLELKYLQYIGRLNFLDQPTEGDKTQVNVVTWSGKENHD